jgi:type II secretion system protein G
VNTFENPDPERERSQERRRERIGVSWGVVAGAVLLAVAGYLWRYWTYWGAAAPAVHGVAAKADLKKIQLTINVFRMEHEGRLPETLRDLVVRPAWAAHWPQGGYMQDVPKDPWGREFVYRRSADGLGFDLFSLGADGAEGGDGDKADIR